MQQLSGHDAVMLAQDGPRTPNHMGPLLICDQASVPGGRVTFKQILAGIEERLHLAPILRRRLVRVPLDLDLPYWIDDLDFDLEFHVRHIALPKPGDWRQLCILAARLMSRPIDLSKPPWELYVIEGLDNVKGVSPGSFAVLMKIHHSSIDGTEGAQLVTALTGTDPHPVITPPTRAWRGESVPSVAHLLARAALRAPARPLTALHLLRQAVPAVPSLVPKLTGRLSQGKSVPTTRFNTAVSPHRVFDSVMLDLDEVKRVRRAVPGVTVNDLALSVVAGALRRYLVAKDELPELSMVAAVPISTRVPGSEGKGGNQIEGTKVDIRTDIADDLERLRAVAATTKDIRTVQKGVSVGHLAQMTELLPGSLLGLGLRAGAQTMARTGIATIANVAITNVPGPRIPLHFLGVRVEQGHGFAPLVDGIGLIHLVSSYVDSLTISINSCREMLPDPAVYADMVRDSFASLSAAV